MLISVPADLESGPSLKASAPGLAKIMADQPKSHRIATSVSAIGASTMNPSRIIGSPPG
ncbi:MAG: hypothetical protein ABI955_03140 [Nitrospirota bacterium]